MRLRRKREKRKEVRKRKNKNKDRGVLEKDLSYPHAPSKKSRRESFLTICSL